MKKIIFALLILSLGISAHAQYVPKGKVTKAETSLTAGKLDEAKAEIDEAFRLDEKGKTTTSGKNWYTRGDIYKAIYLDDSTDYKNLKDDQTLKTAMDSFNKALSLEKENSPYAIFTNQAITQLYGMIVNRGAELYNENDFKGAYEVFMEALVVSPKDTTALLYGGVAAQQADMLDESITCFQTMADNGDANLDTYKTLIYLYRAEKEDQEKALAAVNQALVKFPTAPELVQERITLLILMERSDEAEKELSTAIANDPTNPLYYFFLGYMKDKSEDVEAAIQNYTKAVELNPGYYEANYNLGVMHLEKGRAINKELSEMSLKDWEKNEVAYNERAQVHYREALPYFEKAVEIKPDEDLQLLETLEGLYLMLGMKDKAAELEKKIKALSGI
jgi:tetratricopeptide (TPR) repeat protein